MTAPAGLIPKAALIIASCAVAMAIACAARKAGRLGGASWQSSEVTDVVERLGRRLKDVSLLGPRDGVKRQIHSAYARLVTPALLTTRTSDPASAPGRSVSSPWPARIDIRSSEATSKQGCRVYGEVVYVTSVELTQGGGASQTPVTLLLKYQHERGWRIAAYETSGPRGSGTPSCTRSTVGLAIDPSGRFAIGACICA